MNVRREGVWIIGVVGDVGDNEDDNDEIGDSDDPEELLDTLSGLVVDRARRY